MAEREILERQISDWEAEIRRLAGLVTAACGGGCAFVKITAQDEGYTDVAPELIAEDVLNVTQRGWPAGFDIDILNKSE